MRWIIACIVMSFSSIAFSQDAGSGGPIIVSVNTIEGNDTWACIPEAPCKTLSMALTKVGPTTRRIQINGRMYTCNNGVCSL